MDRKTLLTLFYVSVVLPISYTLAQSLLPEALLLWFGLFNFIVLIIFSLFFSTPISPKPSKIKKIGLILLALFIGSLLFSGLIDSALIQGSSWFRQMMNYSRTDVVAPSHENFTTSWENYTSWENTTWTWTISISDTVSTTGETGLSTELTWKSIILESDDEILSEPTKVVTDETALQKATTTTSSTVDWTYASVIPYLVKTYSLKDTDKSNPVFQFVSAKSSLYTAFATAYSKTMIGKNVNPTTRVSCDTYLVLKWIAAGRKVTYKDSPFAAYRAEAEARSKVNGCEKDKYVTSKTL